MACGQTPWYTELGCPQACLAVADPSAAPPQADRCAALLAVIGNHVLVSVPIATRTAEGASGKKLHEAHTAFQESSRQQAGTAEVRRLGAIESIKVVRACRLVFDGGDFGNGQLHAGRELVTGDARRERIAAT